MTTGAHRPMVGQPDDVTRLLHAWSQGDDGALDVLMPLVYHELHRAAHFHMAREAPDNTLQTTALVNEVYWRLLGAREVDWQNRAHFHAVFFFFQAEDGIRVPLVTGVQTCALPI